MTTIQLVSSESDSFQNPILETGADPWMVEHEGLYYYCFSDNKTSIYVTVASSPLDLARAEEVLVWRAKSGQPYSHQTWAPELYHLDGRWYIYFAASNGRNSTHRLYVLEADQPQGPYRFKGQISPATDRWAIDGTIIEHDDGERYFVWSGWDGRTNIQQNLYISRMLNPWTLASGTKAVLRSRRLRSKANAPHHLEVAVHAEEQGRYVLEIGYSCTANAMHQLAINDEMHIGIHYHTTAANNWQTHFETIELKKGRNILSFAPGIGCVEVREIRVKVRASDRVLISAPEHAWEKLGGPPFVNEGPSAIKRNGRLHVVYSASGSWTDDYQMGLLTFMGGDILDKKNWRKKPSPVFAKTAEVFGPGHASFIRFKEMDWIVYHSAKFSGAGWAREVRMQPFHWTQDDQPQFGVPRPTAERIRLASDSAYGRHEIASREEQISGKIIA